MFNFKTITLTALVLSVTALAQDCFNGNQGSNIHTDDFNNLVSKIQSNNFNPPIANPFELKHKQTHCFAEGTAGVAVRNEYIFENTHVYLNDVVSGAQSVFNKCNAQGGSTTIRGDSSLPLKLFVFSPGAFNC